MCVYIYIYIFIYLYPAPLTEMQALCDQKNVSGSVPKPRTLTRTHKEIFVKGIIFHLGHNEHNAPTDVCSSSWVGKRPLEKGMATHFGTFAWRVARTGILGQNPWGKDRIPVLAGYSPWCHKESYMTEWLTAHLPNRK